MLFCLQMLETKTRPVGKHRWVSVRCSARPLAGAAREHRLKVDEVFYDEDNPTAVKNINQKMGSLHKTI